ncbi:probable cleavage and polyadenylation specificity factor subunit 2 [Drosophila novamexicana]|uniref:probable cleavage and polyadenylation specificity factor subunit 2 n=1 Tax=Drosophila novamexicana TaxID=47314 RepID=UPI0011E5E6E9|nr:probable cleavage and polyadenylation specificity factor subunit 2 [Drosophila novamexicana]XP_032295016.1 probable cleavage and polyadenylation specificity factor subunit 2 [Drosophila virilis]
MTSIIKLHTISGAMDESPPCYILQIDDVRILLDCGWDEKFDPNFIKELKRQVHTLDAVLLSHPDAYHLGALPYLVGKLGLNCPIYATIPVFKMGQMFMYDLYMSHFNMYDFDLFSLDDVDTAFEKITQLKYNQTVSLKGKGYGISITPLSAGHMIGGTIWKIVKVGEEDIIYAIDFNHKKERHLSGCELDRLQRPSLLITDAYNAQYQQARRRARDEKLMTNILQTVRNNGNVLIAVDTAGRVLELAHMLDQLWKNKESGLMAYSLALLNNVSYNVIEFAKSQIEWMSDKLTKAFEGARNNPFQFKHIHLCHTLADIYKLPAGPKVVLASTPDMESGFTRDLFVQWASNPNNSIIFTTRTGPGSLSMELVENSTPGRQIELDVRRRVELEGAELEEYLRTQGEKLNPLIVKPEVEEESSSESEDDIEMSVITGKHDIVVRAEGRHHSGFFKSNKRHHVMFPYHEEKIKYDDYGEVINLDDYRIVDAGYDYAPMDEQNKENVKKEEPHVEQQTNGNLDNDVQMLEKPTKLISQRKTIEVNAQIQRIDFEGRSDGESMLKILSQLRPRRVIVVHGTAEGTQVVAKHCEQNVGARVFAPQKGEIIDVTTEIHIYQVRLTEGLVSQLQFQKGKDAEVAWIDGRLGMRLQAIDAPNQSEVTVEQDVAAQEGKTLTLETLEEDEIPVHNSVLINELKLSDFKQVLMRNNINSEFSGGVLWCSNGTLALRRVDAGKVAMEGCLSEDYYKIRELLYEQYAIV